MNVNVSLPTLIPTQLQPQVEAARTDNRRAELIPQTRSGQASSAETEVGSQKEKSKAGQTASSTLPAQYNRESLSPRFPMPWITVLSRRPVRMGSASNRIPSSRNSNNGRSNRSRS